MDLCVVAFKFGSFELKFWTGIFHPAEFDTDGLLEKQCIIATVITIGVIKMYLMLPSHFNIYILLNTS